MNRWSGYHRGSGLGPVWRLILAVAFSLTVVLQAAPVRAGNETITVNFANNQGPVQHYGSGFLHSITLHAPPDADVAALRPGLWRVGLNNICCSDVYAFTVYPRISWFAPEIQFVASDIWGSSEYSHLTFQNACQAMVMQAEANHWQVAWDLVNEPGDILTPMWDQCYDGVKSADPAALTVGPSYASPDLGQIEKFLLNKRDSGRLPSIVSWHFSQPQSLESDVQTIRTFMARNGIAPRPITINEAIGPPPQIYHSGYATALFAAAERAKVHVGHACWQDGSVNDCLSPVLDGLLTGTGQRRGVWWAYDSYGGMAGCMVRTTTNDIANYDGLASWDARARQATVLIGANDNAPGGTVTLQLDHLRSVPYLVGHRPWEGTQRSRNGDAKRANMVEGRIEAVIERIPTTSGPGSMSLISDTTYPVIDDTVTIPSPVRQYEAVKVLLKNPDVSSAGQFR